MVHLAFCGPCPTPLMQELQKSQKLLNKIVSFYEINLDFTFVVDNAFLTKVSPYDVRLPPDRAKSHQDYVYVESPNDRLISAHRFGLMTGQKIGD
jgi:hypothetical protein